MKTGRNELKAGAFIIITLALALMVVVWIRGANLGPLQTRTISFKLTDDLSGLEVGDDLRLGGYKIGIVRDIHPSGLNGPDPQILVTVTLPSHYVVHRNAAIGIQSKITGTSNLNITSLGTGDPVPDGVAIVGKPDPTSALFASLGEMGPHLSNAIAQVDTQTVPAVTTFVKHANDKVDPIVERYNKVADGASSAAGQLNDLLGDTKPDIRGTLKNLNSATGTIKEKLPGLLEQVTGVIKKVDTSMTTAQAALVDIQKTAANAKDITGSLRSVIVDNQGKLDGIIAGIKTTSDNLKEASIEIRHSPWRLLYKPTPDEAANLNVYDSARAFAEGANSVSDAATALRDAVHDPRSNPAQIQKLIQDLDVSFGHFQDVETKLWTTAKP